jgi:hypothetical protein
MILPQDIAPEKSLYVMGSRVLEILNSQPHNIVDPKIVFDKYIFLYEGSKITYNYFLYALDWLYLLNAIELTESIKIKKCY